MRNLILMVTVPALVGFCFTALAQGSAPGPKDATVTVTGKVEVKDTKSAKSIVISVLEAKNAEGKPIANVKGALLKVTGPKLDAVEKLTGQTVEAKGVVKNGNSIEVASVTPKGSGQSAAAK